MSTDAFALADLLRQHGQEHLLTHARELDVAQRERFLARVAAVDWAELAHPATPPPISAVGRSRVIDARERAQRAAELEARGEEALRRGDVGVLMVAGGQGTRLGSSAPKGCVAIAPHSGKSIYQLQAEKVLSLSRRIGCALPFLVMTSPATDAETRDFFAAHGHFGLASNQVRFFSQGTVPSLDAEGRGLLAEPGRLLENPDGHGGCFTALVASGALDRVQREGVRHLVYIQVDNILARVDDPLLIGLAEAERGEAITKVLRKAHPDEKLGHLVQLGGRDAIVEYTEVTPEQARARDASGELIYGWGSPALHCWSVPFLARLAARGFRPPLHRSRKPLKAFAGAAGMRELTGWKSERFIFDLLPEADVSLGLEIERAAEFAPVKNAQGDDSPATAIALATAEYARWLTAAGVEVALPAGARLEISPLYAATQAQFLARFDRRLARVTGDWYLEEDRAS